MRIGYVLSLLTVAAIVLGGCGSDGETDAAAPSTREEGASTTTTVEEPERPKPHAWGAVFGANSEDAGIILFDLSGHALYRFDRDEGSVPSCYGRCAKIWVPALTEGKLRAVDVPRKLVGTTKRKDGTVQLTYDGHPLYTFSDDGQGETNGQGVEAFGGKWFALRRSGEDVGGCRRAQSSATPLSLARLR
jgi:predicted lipoprotein with Yx(FWY)xxD motif